MTMNEKMRELLSFVKNLAGTSGHGHGFYTECGPCKPWSVRTVKALASRGLVRAVNGSDWRETDMAGYAPEGWYGYLTLTGAGEELFKKGGK